MTFAQRYERPKTYTRKDARAGTRPSIGPESEPNQPATQPRSFNAPVRGLMLDTDIASIPDGGSYLMRNVFPLADRVRARGGIEQRNTGIASEITSIAVYEALPRKAFAFTATQAFDITATGPVGAAVLTGLAPCIWNFQMFATSGGSYLVACGAGNSRRVYDGAAWATTPAITGVLQSALSASWAYANRLFFVQNGTTDAWYLPVDSIGGAAVKFPLGGEITDGGKLLTGATWSTDAGTSLQSTCVFISTEGDVIVYEGPDPSTWSKRGTYRVPRPCGINCVFRSGGDLFIMTVDGLFALSQVISSTLAQTMAQSVSKGIRPLWRKAVPDSTPDRWQIVRRDQQGMPIVLPVKAGAGASAFWVHNAETGAWAVWDGWNPTCMAQFGNELLVGGATGRIGRGEATGADYDAPYTCAVAVPFVGDPGRNTHCRMARAVLRSIENCPPRLSILKDYDPTEPLAPPICISKGGSLWNVAEWNVGKWSGAATARQEWQAVTGVASAVSVLAQVTFAQSQTPQYEFIRFDLLGEVGGLMT